MMTSSYPRGWQRRDMARWKTGDIAYLRRWETFNSSELTTLINSGYMPPKATNHPVIILERRSGKSTHALITPVSAYSAENFNGLAPWNQPAHWRKDRRDFRSFVGSERSTSRKLLYLEEGKSMPKPQASWVNIQSVWVVPVTVLGVFTKSREGHLRVSQDSLDDLTMHMRERSYQWTQRVKDARLAEQTDGPAALAEPNKTKTQRQPPAKFPGGARRGGGPLAFGPTAPSSNKTTATATTRTMSSSAKPTRAWRETGCAGRAFTAVAGTAVAAR
ncbi:hypothetical protein GQ53DRAFT_238664 [Thozetella sp. PMI_491]|nr:hypothetical protein GQ53DRAFT_238664 [Thozetella sp. PMI_491]